MTGMAGPGGSNRLLNFVVDSSMCPSDDFGRFQMKRLVLVLIVLLAAGASCTRVFRDIRIGQSYAVIDPEEVIINAWPSSVSEAFSLEEPEAFVIEGSACADDTAVKDCFSDLLIAGRFKGAVASAFYLVRFESGRQGYINAGYFYPTLSYSLASQERAEKSGFDPTGYANRLRAEKKALKAEAERFEQERIRLIEDSPWSPEIKKLLMDRRLFKGMDKDQAMLSLARAGRHPEITHSDTEKGEMEKWVLDEEVYYFKRGALVKWKMPASEAGDKNAN